MRYDYQKLIDFASAAGEATGMNSDEAKDFGNSLVFADMRGLSSHGLMRMPVYIKRIRAGLVNVNMPPEVTADGGAIISVDGKNAQGACTAMQVMKMCVRRAAKLGSCTAFVRNSNHFGCSGYFTKYAAGHGMIGFAASNSFRAVAPYGGAAPKLGTNPVSLAIPGGKYEPFLLDMATSLVAQGKVILARKEGRQVPEGWGLDRYGNPSTDPGAILDGGTLLPFGGAKGYGIALACEIMSACIAQSARSTTTGSLYDFKRTQNTGYLIAAFDISKVVNKDEYDGSVEALFDDIKATPKTPATDEIFIPGEIEDRKYKAAEENGIEISDTVADELAQTAKELNIPFDCAL